MLDGKLASAGVLIKTFSAKKLFSKIPLSGIMTSHLTSFTCVCLCVSCYKTSSYQHPRHLAEVHLIYICRLSHIIISITIIWVKICSRHKHDINFNAMPQLRSITFHKIFTGDLPLIQVKEVQHSRSFTGVLIQKMSMQVFYQHSCVQ